MMRIPLLISVLLLSLSGPAQQVFLLKDPGSKSVLLKNGWTYSMQDHPDAYLPDFNDSSWKPIRPATDIHDSMPADAQHGVGFMRFKFRVEDHLRGQQLALIVHQTIASEIYLNGKLIQAYGVISNNPDEIKAYDPLWKPIPIIFSTDSIQLLAVRFTTQPGIRYTTIFGTTNPIFSIEILSYARALQVYKNTNGTGTNLFFLGTGLLLFIFHLFFYIMYPKQKANLFLSLFAFCTIISGTIQLPYYLNYVGEYYILQPDDKFFFGNLGLFFVCLGSFMLFITVHRFLNRKPDFYLVLIPLLLAVCTILNATIYNNGWIHAGANFSLFTLFSVLLISFDALRKKNKGAKVFILGAAISFSFFAIFLFAGTGNIDEDETHHLRRGNSTLWSVIFSFYILGLPAAISWFLAREFAATSKRLEQKLVEVETLSAKTLSVEKEKQEMLASQNVILEQKVTQRTEALTHSLQDLKAAQAQLIQSEKMASLGELTAGIAHEIQNPLNFVNNFSEINTELIEELEQVLKSGDGKEAIAIAADLKENEGKINFHGKRADSIVKGMLQHSRTSTGEKLPTDINALCDEYLRLSYHGLRSRDILFNALLATDFDPQIGKVSVISQDISRVLLNLFNNAFYAVNERKKISGKDYFPEVKVTTKKEKENVVITIKDNGTGFPGKIADKIFQPFFTTKPTGQGTGLGLSLSYDIVKAHGGEFRVESEEGNGSVFRIFLPIGNHKLE